MDHGAPDILERKLSNHSCQYTTEHITARTLSRSSSIQRVIVRNSKLTATQQSLTGSQCFFVHNMAQRLDKQKAKICSTIQRSSKKRHLKALIFAVDISDLQSILCQYVTNLNSLEKVSKIFYKSQSLPDIIGIDCTQASPFLVACDQVSIQKMFKRQSRA